MFLEICIDANRGWRVCTQPRVIVYAQQPPLLVGSLARASHGRAAARRETLVIEARGTRSVAQTGTKIGVGLTTTRIGHQLVETAPAFGAVGIICPREDRILSQG